MRDLPTSAWAPGYARRLGGAWLGLLLLSLLGIGMAGSAMAQSATVVVSPPTLPDGVSGSPYNEVITASGGSGSYTFAVTAGSLPTGLVLDASGALTGFPSGTGSSSFTITATDAFGLSGSQAYDIFIQPADMSAPDGLVGAGYSATFVRTGTGTAPFTFTVVGGSLPPGLALTGATDDSVDLTGIPTTAGSYAFDLKISDATGTGGMTGTVSVEILPPNIILTPSLPDTMIGVDYALSLAAAGGIAPYTFAVTAGALPTGVVMDAAGNMSGTTTTAGTFNFTVTATDSGGYTGSQAYTVVIQAATLLLAPATLPDGTVGTAYAETITASGGTGPYSFAVSAGSLPTGLVLDGGGVLSGTPTAAGTFNFTVTATDSLGQTGDQAYAVDIVAVPPPTILLAPATLPDAIVGTTYSQSITASGGTAPYTFAVTSGALPTGVSMDAAGNMGGTATAAGSFNFTVTATDSDGFTGSQAYSVTIQPATILVAPGTLPDGTVGAAYAQTLSASGGTGPYAFAVTAGSLPSGLALDGSGGLSGTPTAAGTFNFTVTATDALGQTGDQAYVVVILAAPPPPTIVLAPATLPDGIVGSAYAQTLTASGGTAPYTFAVTAGTLPPGLSLDSGGSMTGIPTVAGSYDFTITATDDSGASAAGGSIVPMATAMAAVDHNYTLVVHAATITLAPATLPAGSVGTAYEQTLSASGGTAPYSFAVTAGALPAGLALDADGVLGGTPTAAGSFSFTVTATDALDQVGSRAYTLVTAEATLPDPTSNPDVAGLLGSHAASTRAFANVQIVNFVERLETLHVSRRSGGMSSPWGFWLAGALRSGDRDEIGGVSALSFETTGLSGGVDYSFSDAFAFGLGVGYGRDRTAIGTQGSRSDANVPSTAAYGSWHPEDSRVFVDGMLGYQKLDFDVDRFVPESGSTVQAPRNGRQTFTSWSAGYEDENEDETVMWSAYGRADVADATLDAFTEHGDDTYALRYGEQDVRMRTTTLGLRMKFKKEIEWGTLEPRFRVEWQRDFHEDDSVAVSYAHLASGPVFFTSPAALDRSRVVLELGSLLRTERGFILRLDYRGVFGGFNDREHWLRFSMEEYDD